MITTAIVTGIKFKTIPSGNNKCFYNHILYFDDGTNGVLKGCTEPSPSWLQKGINLECDIQPGLYGNFIVPIKADGMPIENKLLSPEFQKKNQEKQKTNNIRIEDIPEYWLSKQKCITMISVLKNATELVCAGKLKLKDLHKHAINDFKVVMEQSGLNES